MDLFLARGKHDEFRLKGLHRKRVLFFLITQGSDSSRNTPSRSVIVNRSIRSLPSVRQRGAYHTDIGAEVGNRMRYLLGSGNGVCLERCSCSWAWGAPPDLFVLDSLNIGGATRKAG